MFEMMVERKTRYFGSDLRAIGEIKVSCKPDAGRRRGWDARDTRDLFPDCGSPRLYPIDIQIPIDASGPADGYLWTRMQPPLSPTRVTPEELTVEHVERPHRDANPHEPLGLVAKAERLLVQEPSRRGRATAARNGRAAALRGDPGTSRAHNSKLKKKQGTAGALDVPSFGPGVSRWLIGYRRDVYGWYGLRLTKLRHVNIDRRASASGT
jgi:hypothetical protein